MADAPQTMFSQIDVTSVVSSPTPISENERAEQRHSELVGLLRELNAHQKRQNEILVQLLNQQMSAQRQRANELQAWRNAHPDLAQGCRELLTKMSEMQVSYFTRMCDDSHENSEDWEYSEFMFNDFIDRFGPRLVHMNGLMQALAQLATPPEANK